MLLIPWCNLICSELVHSILLFKVSLIWEVLLMSADYSYWVILMSADYRVHLHVFKKIQLQSSKSCMCVTSAEKFKKRQSWKMWPVFLYFAKQPLSSLYREVWRSGKGDRVKERACEWVESELCIVKNKKIKKSTEVKTYMLKKNTSHWSINFLGGGHFLFEREEEVTIQESSKEVKESNEEVYWSRDGKKNHWSI